MYTITACGLIVLMLKNSRNNNITGRLKRFQTACLQYWL